MKIKISKILSLFRRIYNLAKPYGRKKLALVGLMSLAQGFFQMVGVTSVFPFLALAANPKKIKDFRILDLLFPEHSRLSDNQILLIAGALALSGLLLANFVSLLSDFTRARYGAGFANWLRCGLLRKMAFRPYGDFLRENTSILIKKVAYDVGIYTGSVLLPLLDSISRMLTVVFLIGAVFLINPAVALGAALTIALFYASVFRIFSAWRQRASDRLKISTRGAYVNCQQLLSGIKPVKIHLAETEFLGRYAKHSKQQAHFQSLVPLLGVIPRYLVEPLALGSLIATVMWFAAKGDVFTDILPTLGVMAMAGYRILPSFQMMYSQFTEITTSRHTLDEICDEMAAAEENVRFGPVLSQETWVKPRPLLWNQQIEIRNVSFSYPGTKNPILEKVNLIIEKHSSVGICGETGTGKSTFIDLLLGLHTPTQGKILVDGIPLDSGKLRAWRASVGYVPQEIYLTDDTIAANIAFGIPLPHVDMKRVREVAMTAQIHEFIEKELPEQYETLVGERGVRLSGGQRQRIGLARALYHQPELLVLDEATSALDYATEAEVMKAIYALRGKVTMLIVAHRLSTIEKCQKTIQLSKVG